MPGDPFVRAIGHFNAEEYREALLAFEERWSGERSNFLKALIQLCNALLQLSLGLVTGPRRTLASATILLEPYAPDYQGLDVAQILGYIGAIRRCIPDDMESGQGSVVWEAIPRLQLKVGD